MCTYEHLVEVTLAHGRIPLVVPQLRTITLGGAVERARHRVDQLPQRAAARVGARDGRADRVRARSSRPSPATTSSTPSPTPTARSATPPGCASSSSRCRRTSPCGTCGSTTRPRWPRRSRASWTSGEWDGRAGRRRSTVSPSAPGELYLTLARWTDEPGPTSDYTGQQVFYRSLQQRADRPADHPRLPVALGHRLVLVLAGVRRPAPRRTPGVAAPAAPLRRLLEARRARPPLRHRRPARPAGRPAAGRARRAGRRDPVDRLAEFLDWFDREVGMRPVWLCPLRLRRGGAGDERPWPGYPLTAGTTYVNVGLLGRRQRRPRRAAVPAQPRHRGQGLRARRPQEPLLRGVLRAARSSTASTAAPTWPGSRRSTTPTTG